MTDKPPTSRKGSSSPRLGATPPPQGVRPANSSSSPRLSPVPGGRNPSSSPVLQASSPSLAEKSGSEEKDSHRVDGPIICPGHSRPVPDCTYSNVTDDGYFLISACLDGKAMLREGPTGDWIGTFMGHKGAVWCARLNAPATFAATASADFSAKVWDAISGTCLFTLQHKHIVKTVLFSKDSKHLFSGGMEKKMRIFDLEKHEAEPQILEGHESCINSLVLTPAPHLIVSGAAENNARVWDLRTGTTVKTLPTDQPVTSMTISNDGQFITTTHGNTVTMWTASSFACVKTFTLPQTLDCAAFHPLTKKFVTGSNDELWVRGYDFDSGEELACNKGHHGPVRSVCFNPEGTNYASGSEDGTIRIWEWGGGN